MTMWKCICDCEKTVVVSVGHLKSGHTKSCGCLQKEKAINTAKWAHILGNKACTKHGFANERIYQTYRDMISRCYNPKCKAFKDYGAKGITVYDEWRNSMEDFIKWAMANGYNDKMTIDRKENTKGYSPDNCHWITRAEQNQNTTRNLYVVINGVKKTISQWAKEFDISPEPVYILTRKGVDPTEALLSKIPEDRVNVSA